MNAIDLVHAESDNFRFNLERLGETAGLVTLLETHYQALTPCLTFPDAPKDGEALAAVVHLFALCRRLLTMSVLTLLKGYRADSLLHLRRAIEFSAFARRLALHPELVPVWGYASKGNDEYKQYRKAFHPNDLFPDKQHSEYNALLESLKGTYDLCSRLMHGSVYAVAGHFGRTDTGLRVLFFDLPSDHSLFSTLSLILGTHRDILSLFGRIVQQHTNDQMLLWWGGLELTAERLRAQAQRWASVMPQTGTS